MTLAGDTLARLVRDEGTRVLATLVRVIGSVDLAEDAVQDAVVRALETWPRDGVPDNPRAWLLVTARRRAVDVLRREAKRVGKEADAMPLPDDDPPQSVIRDDLLRLVFTCCHPCLSVDAQVALSLRTLGGLSTAEVARGLRLPEATAAKRLTRAKQKIATAGIPYRVPSAEELPERLSGVAATVYLIFNEGYAGVRAPLVDEAVRLARLLASLMPDEPTVLGLLALLLLHDARRCTRVGDDGLPVLLADQDRSLWDAVLIQEGVVLVGQALRRTPSTPNPYVVEAAIAACHVLAPTYAATNWDAVISWYDVLFTVRPSPVVALNRAAAVAERDGASVALPLVLDLADLADYPWWHATRAELLHRLGNQPAALAALTSAESTGLHPGHAARLRRRLGE
ncbi:sigma-70 family RNA polymerase sigma factor [Amycolatopsis rhabdoformis]|uniref:Sigma-70 family RNA polymerase sigma factor n=1 Tax=Amycolatopsis rhabdoformis TaxID=1448059 RepID=A0ABZ1I1E1_9PSEU|nr:sigma-70 family RNA polymerase sigma factor [Amycolatopsis rhabdoformis]WSE28216.1 sigma-70 family RNA polymerase sigma factor [Amycolatopsis rhabdoformis]